jgi:hypothetical protein
MAGGGPKGLVGRGFVEADKAGAHRAGSGRARPVAPSGRHGA